MSLEQKDLTTTKGGEIPIETELTTPEASNSGFEVTDKEKELKRLGEEDNPNHDSSTGKFTSGSGGDSGFKSDYALTPKEQRKEDKEWEKSQKTFSDRSKTMYAKKKWNSWTPNDRTLSIMKKGFTFDTNEEAEDFTNKYMKGDFDKLSFLHKQAFITNVDSYRTESLAKEEGLASISGPPADSTMHANNFGKKKENTLIITNDGEENLTDTNLSDDNLTDKELGEDSSESLQHILLNETYIQDQFGVFYRPVYVGENYIPHYSDLIFENKIYTTEGLGNCTFCQGAGKVTVENLGLKDCPDCDGTGDIQTQAPVDPMAQLDPNAQMDPNANPNGQIEPPQPDANIPTPEEQAQVPNEGAPDQFGQEPEKDPDDHTTLIDMFNDDPKRSKESYAKEDNGWITVKGNHIELKGRTPKEATDDFLADKKGDKKTTKPKEKKKREFTVKDYERNENRNADTLNAYNLVKKYGTPEELEEMEGIKKRHGADGISNDDYNRRYEISNKYYDNLVNDSGKKEEPKPSDEDNTNDYIKNQSKSQLEDRLKDGIDSKDILDSVKNELKNRKTELNSKSNSELNDTLNQPFTTPEQRKEIEDIFDERLDTEIVKDGANIIADKINSEGKSEGDMSGVDLLRFQSSLQNKADTKNSMRDYEGEDRENARNVWGFNSVDKRFLIKALGLSKGAMQHSSPTLMDNEDAVKLIEYSKGIKKDDLLQNISDAGKNYFNEAKLKDGYIKCDHCDQQFSSVQWLVDHVKEQHPNASESVSHDKCPHCEFETSWKEGDDIQKQDAEREMSEHKSKHGEVSECKKKASEANIIKYKTFINTKINILKTRARSGEAVSLMYGLPTISKQGRKIKGILAYAGVSLNDRIYLPEELAKGHGKTLPLLLNHSSIAGAEEELYRLTDEMVDHLKNEKDYQLGEVTLNWDAEKLTLYYEGVVDHPFFQKEIDDMNMAVSLGIFYDSDSPQVCDETCYTIIKGAEFREVSLVYHAGFPIATIEAVEVEIKRNAKQAMEDINDYNNEINGEPEEGFGEQFDTKEETEAGYKKREELDESTAEEETDELARGGSVDVEEEPMGEAPVIDLSENMVAESLTTNHDFSISGVTGMTISNSNGVERYTLDPSMSYETNMIHFNVSPRGAQIYGEELQLQPKMTTPPELTKEIEKQPPIKFTDADEDAFKKKVK